MTGARPTDAPAALVVDYGGVLTTPLSDSMGAWAQRDDVDLAQFGAVMKEWLGPGYADDPAVQDGTGNPVHALETGAMSIVDFERVLAERLRTRDGGLLRPDGLLQRMFDGFRREPVMVSVVRRVRQSGFRTALLSNSWGVDYPREDWAELFDVTVISGEVGMRKPDPQIYLLTAERLGVDPARCVFVDDLRPNIRGAAAVGMVGVHHTEPEATVAELETLLGLPLR